jgi:cytoskeletal protein CcmA (bactofilin family)
MTEKLKGDVLSVPRGQLIDNDIIIVANRKYFSSLIIGGKVLGNVSVFQEQALSGGLCPTNVHVIILLGGSLTGNISGVDHVEIFGEYSGNIDAAGSIKIHEGAIVKGNLHCVWLYKGEDTEVEAQVTAQVCKKL